MTSSDTNLGMISLVITAEIILEGRMTDRNKKNRCRNSVPITDSYDRVESPP